MQDRVHLQYGEEEATVEGVKVAISLFATPVEKGALSQVWAAVSPDAWSGQYYGPVAKAEAGSKLCQDKNLHEEVFKWIQGELEGHVQTVA